MKNVTIFEDSKHVAIIVDGMRLSQLEKDSTFKLDMEMFRSSLEQSIEVHQIYYCDAPHPQKRLNQFERLAQIGIDLYIDEYRVHLHYRDEEGYTSYTWLRNGIMCYEGRDCDGVIKRRTPYEGGLEGLKGYLFNYIKYLLRSIKNNQEI